MLKLHTTPTRPDGYWYTLRCLGNEDSAVPARVRLQPLSHRDIEAMQRAEVSKRATKRRGVGDAVASIMRRMIEDYVLDVEGIEVVDSDAGTIIRPSDGAQLVKLIDRLDSESADELLGDIVNELRTGSSLRERVGKESSLPSASTPQAASSTQEAPSTTGDAGDAGAAKPSSLAPSQHPNGSDAGPVVAMDRSQEDSGSRLLPVYVDARGPS